MDVILVLGTKENVGICYINLNPTFVVLEGGRLSPDWPGTHHLKCWD